MKVIILGGGASGLMAALSACLLYTSPLKIVTADAVKMLASGAGKGYTVGRRYIPDRSTKEEGL